VKSAKTQSSSVKSSKKNKWKRWTQEEEEELVSRIKDHMSFDDVASALHRNAGGVRARVSKIVDEILQEHDGDEIKAAASLNITVNSLRELLDFGRMFHCYRSSSSSSSSFSYHRSRSSRNNVCFF
jgi:thiamine biosynthesis lipoprotein ApbE